MKKHPNIRIGVSACLLGEKVRYDGGHRRNSFVADTLADLFELVPVCPESELGMGVPRETVDLVGKVEAPRMIGTNSRKDWTDSMSNWALQKLKELEPLNLCGFVLKKGSPSCGVHRVPVIQENGEQLLEGLGLFAMAVKSAYPNIPMEDELQLEDQSVHEKFIESIIAQYAMRRSNTTSVTKTPE